MDNGIYELSGTPIKIPNLIFLEHFKLAMAGTIFFQLLKQWKDRAIW